MPRRLEGIVLVLALFAGCNPMPALAAVSEQEAVDVIIGEAADQGYAGMLAVAEVIRRRGSLGPFCASRRPGLALFVAKQGKRVRKTALAAWRASQATNTTFGATHYENVNRFGRPAWSKKMRQVAVVKDHVFYR